MRTIKGQISLRVRAVWSAPLLFFAWIVYKVWKVKHHPNNYYIGVKYRWYSSEDNLRVGYKTPYPIPIPSRFYPSQFSILCSIGSLSVEFHYLVFPKIIWAIFHNIWSCFEKWFQISVFIGDFSLCRGIKHPDENLWFGRGNYFYRILYIPSLS